MSQLNLYWAVWPMWHVSNFVLFWFFLVDSMLSRLAASRKPRCNAQENSKVISPQRNVATSSWNLLFKNPLSKVLTVQHEDIQEYTSRATSSQWVSPMTLRAVLTAKISGPPLESVGLPGWGGHRLVQSKASRRLWRLCFYELSLMPDATVSLWYIF